MAKTTATIIGLVLAAVAIGVNTAQYPIVWQMTDPALAARPNAEQQPPPETPPQPAAEAPPATADGNNRAVDESKTPATGDQPDDAPRSGDSPGPAINEKEAAPFDAGENYSSPPEDALEPDIRPAARPMIEEPLAPVNFAGLSGNPGSLSSAREPVRRLPLVGRPGPAPIVSRSNNGAIPVYPSTGIE